MKTEVKWTDGCLLFAVSSSDITLTTHFSVNLGQSFEVLQRVDLNTIMFRQHLHHFKVKFA